MVRFLFAQIGEIQSFKRCEIPSKFYNVLSWNFLVRKVTTNQWNLFYTAKSGKYHRPEKQPFPLEISLYNLWGCFSQPFWSHSGNAHVFTKVQDHIPDPVNFILTVLELLLQLHLPQDSQCLLCILGQLGQPGSNQTQHIFVGLTQGWFTGCG